MLGGPFSPFSRAISSRCAATICRSAATSASNCTTSALSWVGFSASGSSGSGTRRLNRKTAAKRPGKCQPPQRRRLRVTFSTHLTSQRPTMPGILPVLYFAEVVQTTVSPAGEIKLDQVWVVGDVGSQIINPSGAVNQVQGAALDGVGAALGQRVTLER